MKKTEYCSSLTEAQFEQIKPCLTIKRRSKWRLLDIVNAILYLCDGGSKWREVPHDFGMPWQTVYWYFQKWSRQGVWQAVNDSVVMLRRMDKEGAPTPSYAVVDSETVHNTPTATEAVGVDAGKRSKAESAFLWWTARGTCSVCGW